MRCLPFRCIRPFCGYILFASDHLRRARCRSRGHLWNTPPPRSRPSPAPFKAGADIRETSHPLSFNTFLSLWCNLLFFFFFFCNIFHGLGTRNLSSPCNFLLHFGVGLTQSQDVFNYSVVIKFIVTWARLCQGNRISKCQKI